MTTVRISNHSVTRTRRKLAGAANEPVPPSLEAISYDPVTGFFTWNNKLVSRRAAGLIGKRAGCVNAYGYRVIRIDRVLYQESRLAWLKTHGSWPDGEIDHINCDRSDNRIRNLRVATRTQNAINTRIPKTNRSGFKGVSWHARDRAWRARIGKQFLGYFSSAEDAHQAYIAAASSMHGEFARAR